MRGRKAAQLQLIYMAIMGILFLSVLAFKLLVFLLWMLWLPIALMFDFVIGFVRGVLAQPEDGESQ